MSKFLESAGQAWTRLTVRHHYNRGYDHSWPLLLGKIGDDSGFRGILSGERVSQITREDVAKTHSNRLNPLFAFIAPRPDLLGAGQSGLNSVLHTLVTDRSHVGVMSLAVFTQRVRPENWPLFAPALDAEIVRDGSRRLLGHGGSGAGELLAAAAIYRPDLLPAAKEGLDAGARRFFAATGQIANYAHVLHRLEPAQELRRQLLHHPAGQAFAAIDLNPGSVLPEGATLQATQDGRIVAHLTGQEGRGPVDVPSLGMKWLSQSVAHPADMRVASLFRALASLAHTPDSQISAPARAVRDQLVETYKRHPYRKSLSPVQRDSIEFAIRHS